VCLKATIKTGRRFAPSIAFASLLLFLAVCGHPPAPQQIAFRGALKAGERFQHQFGGRFIFALRPTDDGWYVAVYEQGRREDLTRLDGRREDLARLTLPFHGPNPTQIEGWHFRNQDNTKPNDGSVNAPQEEREFIFSPEVGRSIPGPASHGELTLEDIDRVSSFGRGVLHIEHLVLSPLERGARARILEMEFRCTISWSNRMAVANARWLRQFRFAVHAFWLRLADFWPSP